MRDLEQKYEELEKEREKELRERAQEAIIENMDQELEEINAIKEEIERLTGLGYEFTIMDGKNICVVPTEIAVKATNTINGSPSVENL